MKENKLKLKYWIPIIGVILLLIDFRHKLDAELQNKWITFIAYIIFQYCVFNIIPLLLIIL